LSNALLVKIDKKFSLVERRSDSSQLIYLDYSFQSFLFENKTED